MIFSLSVRKGMLIFHILFLSAVKFCRSAKAGYYASRYKRFGNLCYVLGALQAFMGHRNEDLRIRVSAIYIPKCSPFLFLSHFYVYFSLPFSNCIVFFSVACVIFMYWGNYRLMRVSGKYILK